MMTMLFHARRRSAGLWACAAAFLAVAAASGGLADRTGVAQGYLTPAGRAGAASESSAALAQAGGEFRIVAADLIWLNVVDHYHHQFMAQGGDWSRNKEILPLLHVITLLDPHFIQSYDVGSLILCRLDRFPDARRMLREGIAANPHDWQLPYDMAMVYAWYEKNPAAALPYAVIARQRATDPFDVRRIGLLCRTLRRDIRTGKPSGGGAGA